MRQPVRRVLVGMLAALSLAALVAPSASAEFTHKYLGQITLASGTEPQPFGVDAAGNILVWLDDQEVIAKYDTSGNPVNFSALGTNILDGFGGLECVDVPADCDRVPSGRFGPIADKGVLRSMAVVDQSNSPAKGYIYVKNHDKDARSGEINVFAPSGEYLGNINEALPQPWADPGRPAASLSMGPNGNLYVTRGEGQEFAGSMFSGGHTDIYAPTSGDPADTVAVGQVRLGFQVQPPHVNFPARYAIGLGANGALVSDLTTSSAVNDPLGSWRWYSIEEFQRQPSNYLDLSLAKDFLPFPRDNNKAEWTRGALNPATQNLHLFGSSGPGMVIYGPDLHTRIGPRIGLSSLEIADGARDVGFDNSGTANQGRFYIKGGTDKLSIFSAPVVIPDITVGEPQEGHTTATVNAVIDDAGGPEVTACTVDYGLTKSFGTTKPCNPGTPYTGTKNVSVDLEGLFTEADYYYRVQATNSNGMNETFENVLHTVAVLETETGAVTNLASTSATLNGSLDPDGMPTTYKFQYGLDTNYDLETPSAGAGSGTGAAPVTPVGVEDLQPGRTYHYRLVATNALGTTFGDDRTFTAPARPLIAGLNATNVLATSADVHARIQNYDSDATYYVEYGTSVSYDRKTPEVELGPQAAFQSVTVYLTDLQPGLTYNFRFVATNDHGTSTSSNATFDFAPPSNCPNSHVRQQTGSNYLPDCRAYELVSPGRAGSVQLFPGDLLFRLPLSSPLTQPDVKMRYQNAGLATTPSRFGYFGAFGGIEGSGAANFLLDHYVASRTSTGWETTFPALKGDESGLSWKGQCSVTFNLCLDYAIDLSPTNNFGRAPFAYLWDVSGKFITRLPTNFAVVPEADHLTGDEVPSGDFSHFVFSSSDLAFAPGGLETAPGSAYDNAIGPKTVSVISKLPGGGDLPQDAGTADEYVKIAAVTNNGSHILMSTVAPGGRTNLFMRVNDAVTHEVSPGVGVQLLKMSADGSKVAFLSDSVLTGEDEDSSRDIYLWDEATQDVTLITTGNGKGNSDACNANWTAGCNVAPITSERPDIDDVMSSSGDVYFYSPEQLDPDNPGVFNQRNLYHVNEGDVQYVTTFDPGTQANRMQIGADGRHAAFLTKAELTGYESSYFNTFGVELTARQMYMFDADTGEVQCASCNPTGQAPTILRSDPPGNSTGAVSADVLASKNGRFMSDDGRTAFATSDQLSPRDSNEIIDVYEFVDGRPQLITAGNGDRDLFPSLALLIPGVNTGLEAVSRDGRDIFFSTYDTLVSQDENGAFIKMYVARTGGGFPVEGELLPCEAADECHGETTQPASNPDVGTGTEYTVSGNVVPQKKKKAAKKKAAKKKKAQRKKQKKRRRQSRERGEG